MRKYGKVKALIKTTGYRIWDGSYARVGDQILSLRSGTIFQIMKILSDSEIDVKIIDSVGTVDYGVQDIMPLKHNMFKMYKKKT